MLSVWSAGCADGAELHTLGLVLSRMGALERAVLLGSDLLERTWRSRGRRDVPGARCGRGCAGNGATCGGRAAAGPLAADPLPQRRDLPVTAGAPAGVRDAGVGRSSARGVLLLGRSERLIDPGALGLRPVGPHAYERVA